jgi:hypothetical protein
MSVKEIEDFFLCAYLWLESSTLLWRLLPTINFKAGYPKISLCYE